jgi:arylsulfatase A-like enzyme
MRSARAALLVAVMLAPACARPPRPGTPPRHALLITVSGLRADHLSAYGYPRPTTAAEPLPGGVQDLALDALAASGVTFAQAFAPGADDALALAALSSGSNAPAHGAPTLAEAFAAAGFRTGAFLTGAAAEAPSLARGAAHVATGSGPDPDYDAVRQAVEWLREAEQGEGQRIFLWLHLSGPAAPWDPAPLGKEDFRARYADPDYAGAIDGSAAALAALADPAAAFAGPDLAQLVALYDAEVARVNQLVRQLLSALAGRFELLPRDLLADTVVVLAGARGCELFQHARAPEDPRSLYDASLRVPLVLRHPASLTGKRVLAELVELRDVAPTLRDWFDLPPAEGAEGRSLLALTDSFARRSFASRPVVLRREDGGSVRTEEWHLIASGGKRLLFDVARDPLEQRDLAAAEEERASALAAELAPGR